jgi:hypothetical protein
MTRTKSDSTDQIKKKKFIADQAVVLRLSVILTLVFYIGCATLSGNQVGRPRNLVTVKEIVEMSKAGIPPATIINTIRQSQTVYRLQASQLVQLKEMGVSDEVINYMQQTYINAVRKNQAYEDWSNFNPAEDGFWYGGPIVGGPFLY